MAYKKGLGNLQKDKMFNEEPEGEKSVGNTVRTLTIENERLKNNIEIIEKTDKLKWSLICDRYTNDFDYDPEQDKRLKEEIKEFGLQHAIIVVEIDKYLSLNGISDDAKNYYNDAKKQGFKYYILSGHRRSRAVMSLCYGNNKNVGLDKTEFYKWYKKEFTVLSSEEAEKRNPWSVVKVQEYIPKSKGEEEKLTQIENFSNRVIKTFTWVYNSYKMLSEKEKATAEDVTNYIKEQYGVELSSGHIGNYLTTIKTFKDQRYIQAIFQGIITPYTAKKLTSFYKNKLDKDDELREKVIKELHSHTTDQEEYVNELIGKKSKEKKKEKKDKLTKKAILNLIERIESNEITLEEFKEIIIKKY